MYEKVSGVKAWHRRAYGRLLGLWVGLLLTTLFSSALLLAADDDELQRPATVGSILPNDWHISPAGTQVTVGNLPANGALTPDGRYLAVTNNGCSEKTQEISIVDLQAGKKVSSVQVDSLFLGIAFSTDGHELYVSGGYAGKIYRFAFAGGVLTADGAIPVRGYPAGLTLLPDGKLAVAENTSDKITLVELHTGKVTTEIPVGRYPYWVTATGDGRQLYVSNWGSNSVSLVDLTAGKEVKQIPVGKLPEAMQLSTDGARLYVANTNSDSVSVIDTASGQVTQTIELSFKTLPAGAAPTGMALSPGGDILYVSLAGVNADAVEDLQANKIRGYIPAGWYPTAVFVNPSLHQLITLSGKGMGIGPDPNGAKPGTNAPNQSQYIYNMITGIASDYASAEYPAIGHVDRTVQQNSLDDASRRASARTAAQNPIPRHQDEASPIKPYVYLCICEKTAPTTRSWVICRGRTATARWCCLAAPSPPMHTDCASSLSHWTTTMPMPRCLCRGMPGPRAPMRRIMWKKIPPSTTRAASIIMMPASSRLLIRPNGYIWKELAAGRI